MKTTVIYHSADFDGIFCRQIAHKFLGDQDVEYIGWNFGDPRIEIPEDGNGRFDRRVYIMDLPPDCVAGLPETWTEGLLDDPVIWIDHHKTSIETWPSAVPGYRIDGVAACRLAWQWFQGDLRGCTCEVPHSEGHYDYCPRGRLPVKQDFIDRTVVEPLAVRLAGEYDIWDKRDPRAETFQYGLRVEEPDWKLLLEPELAEESGADMGVGWLLSQGVVAQTYARNVDASICKSLTWLMEWEGLKFLCVNHARFNSLLFAAKDTPETGHDALLGFRFDGKTWMVSLYHAKHRTDLDLSKIAVKYGGGGHRGACGFTTEIFPFTTAP